MNLQELLTLHPLPPLGDGSKDQRANVFVVGGPPDCPGAVVLAATAALRTGAGRVRVAVHPDVAPAVGVAVPELAVYAWTHAASPTAEIARGIESSDVVLVGPGYRHLDESLVRSISERATQATLVLDAGALPATRGLARTRAVVVAPNASEARELLGREPEDETDELTLATQLSEELGQPVAVRGRDTVVADGDQWWRLEDSPRGLGTPGSGDVFAGVLAAVLGSVDDVTAALGWAVHLHATSAARLASETPVGYRASDIVEQLPYAIAELPLS